MPNKVVRYSEFPILSEDREIKVIGNFLFRWLRIFVIYRQKKSESATSRENDASRVMPRNDPNEFDLRRLFSRFLFFFKQKIYKVHN